MQNKLFFKALIFLCLTTIVFVNPANAGGGKEEKVDEILYKGKLSKVYIPSSSFKTAIKNKFLAKNANSAQVSYVNSESDSESKPYEGCDDETSMLEGVTASILISDTVDCPTVNPTVEKTFQSYECALGPQISKRVTTTYASFSSLYSAQNLLDFLHEDPDLSHITLDDAFGEMAGKCLKTKQVIEEFSNVCVGSTLRPKDSTKMVFVYKTTGSLNDGFGSPLSLEITGDNAVWDLRLSHLIQREFVSTKHAITTRPDSDPKSKSCGELKIGFATGATYKKHFHSATFCDKNRPYNNHRCASTNIDEIAARDCTILKPDNQWIYKYGAEGTTKWNYSRNFNLVVQDYFNGCTRNKRIWFGDNPAFIGTAQGIPIYWSTVQWFHTKTSGTFIWNQNPVDSNWNGTYIFSPGELPPQD
jgi:hypothetical protein